MVGIFSVGVNAFGALCAGNEGPPFCSGTGKLKREGGSRNCVPYRAV